MTNQRIITVTTWGLVFLVAGCTSDAKESAGPTKRFDKLFEHAWTIEPGVETYYCGYKTLTDDLYISDFRPIMPSGTHHVVLGYQDPAVPDGVVPFEEGAPVSPSTCTGFTFGDFFAFGAGVGTEELAMPDGVAVKISAGKQLVFGLHVINTLPSPLSGTSGIEVVSPEPAKVANEAEVIAAASPFVSVPPGNVTQSLTCTMVADSTIFAVMAHMHLTGVHMTTTAGPADGGTVPLLNMDYDFADQRYRMVDPPVSLHEGDKMTVECDYQNPGPNTLTTGESTTKNEMCVTFAYRYPAARTSNNALGLPPGYCVDAPPDPSCGDVSAPGLEIIASGLPINPLWGGNSPAILAVDATSVYWVNNTVDGSVMRAPIAGGTPTTLASHQPGPWGIAIDAANAYWTDFAGGTVMKVPIAGGTPTTLASAQSSPNAIVVDATNAYWTNFDSGTIMKAPLAGGEPTALYSGADHPDTLAVDSSSVFWTNGDGRVMKVPLGGGDPTTLASGQTPQGIAVDSTSVYWVNASDGSARKVPLTGGTPMRLGTGEKNSTGWCGIATDATSVYWTNHTGGTVMKAPLGGGTTTTLASGLQHPLAIAVDATSVYWTDTCGRVVKLTPK